MTVSDSRTLSDIDRERFADIVETSLDVTSRHQFFVWTQSLVQALVPHEILVCGIEDGSRKGMVMHRFSASRYFRQEHFDAVSDAVDGLLPHLLAVAKGSDRPAVFSPGSGERPVDIALQTLVADKEMKNLAAYFVNGTRGNLLAFYGFARVAAPLDARMAYMLELLVPHLHNAFLRVLSLERDVVGANAQRSGRLITPRQEEILNLIKRGKTNAEIAEVLECSPWTIKNHIQAILRKLDTNTRTHALARAMSLGLLSRD
jgi:transcriptional regulator EpsA